MKTKAILKEAIIWMIIAVPFVYYAILYKDLPSQIPIHFDIHGNPDNFASKSGYWWVLATTTLGIYLLMIAIPLIDPKKRIKQMGNKYYSLKLLIVGLIAIINAFSIYVAANPGLDIKMIILVILGVVILVLGNYMPAFKPNYFIGIRTPWTLESEEIWRKTHRMGGWLWSITGILTIILALINVNPLIIFVLIMLASFIPVIYSFVLYLKKEDE